MLVKKNQLHAIHVKPLHIYIIITYLYYYYYIICSITAENLAEYISQEVWLSSVKLNNK